MRKILVSAALFALSWCVFALLGNPLFATVLLALLSIHEAGHLIAMRRYGITLKGLYFIPLLGAVIVPADRVRTREAGLMISLGGPLAGLVSVFAALGVYAIWPSPEAATAAYFAALINFFNMVPLFPLDGGQALAHALDDGTRTHASIARKMWICYFAGLGFILLALDAWMIAALAAYFGYHGIKAFLVEMGRREDQAIVRAELAKTFGVAPAAVSDAAEAPFIRSARGEDPEFPEPLLTKESALREAEGLRRLSWSVPEDVEIPDDAAEAWGATLEAHLETNALRAYAFCLARSASRAVPARKTGPFGGESVLTGVRELSPHAFREGEPSPLRKFLASEAVPASTPAAGRRGRAMYASLGIALGALTLLTGIMTDWSIKGLL